MLKNETFRMIVFLLVILLGAAWLVSYVEKINSCRIAKIEYDNKVAQFQHYKDLCIKEFNDAVGDYSNDSEEYKLLHKEFSIKLENIFNDYRKAQEDYLKALE